MPRFEIEKVLTVVVDTAIRDFVGVVPGDDLGERALPRSVGSHNGVYLTGFDRQVDAVKDLGLVDTRTKVLDFQHVETSSADGAFEADVEQRLRLDGKLHR